jgi:hypothetical protein
MPDEADTEPLQLDVLLAAISMGVTPSGPSAGSRFPLSRHRRDQRQAGFFRSRQQADNLAMSMSILLPLDNLNRG